MRFRSNNWPTFFEKFSSNLFFRRKLQPSDKLLNLQWAMARCFKTTETPAMWKVHCRFSVTAVGASSNKRNAHWRNVFHDCTAVQTVRRGMHYSYAGNLRVQFECGNHVPSRLESFEIRDAHNYGHLLRGGDASGTKAKRETAQQSREINRELIPRRESSFQCSKLLYTVQSRKKMIISDHICP